MISVTRLNDAVLIINAEAIQSVEVNSETVITFSNRDRLIVKEGAEEIYRRILRYRRSLHQKVSSVSTHVYGYQKPSLH
jgi:uncharacterized protein YlzI (FlbEa/FlbD family)